MKFFASLILLIAAISAAAAEPIERQVTVKGQGKALVTPDFVLIEMSIGAEGADTARLKEEVDDKTSRLLDVAAKFKIAARDVRSSGVNIGQVYESDRNDNDVFKGYQVGRSLEVKLRAISDYEAFAQELVAAGMESVESIKVGVDDESRLRAPALAAAAKDARVKAQAVSESLGIAIGLPIEVGEDRLWYDDNLVQIAPSGGMGEIIVAGSRSRSNFSPLLFTPHDVEVEAEVWVRFSITPAGST